MYLGKAIEIVCRYDGRMFTYDRIFYAKDTTLTYGGPHSQQQQLLSERFAKRSTRSERPFLPQPSTLPSLGEGLGVGVSPPSLGEGPGVGVSYAPEGALICQPRATPGGEDAAGIRPRRGQKNDSPPLQSGKGVSEIIILLPILGECWLRTIPKATPWADLFWPFFLHFVLKASKLERRPYLPQPSTLPSLGRGWGWVSVLLPLGNRQSRFACRRKATGSCSCKRTKFERASFARVIDGVASLIEE